MKTPLGRGKLKKFRGCEVASTPMLNRDGEKTPTKANSLMKTKSRKERETCMPSTYCRVSRTEGMWGKAEKVERKPKRIEEKKSSNFLTMPWA